ncbi:uncharacterized protein LOC117646299 [Thrips palmi]|uniref:Uncharacterized protein LOC117646299 n=1 Tax=Thrips palmi TaxID=161013 RepID=A0A6P8Z0C5_THRPL|nr:uncharacterized protein LOC117646299 [Thrips palmi]
MANVRHDSRNSTSFILCLVLDLSFPRDGVLYKKCLQALENVLAWALYAPHNLSVVGVMTINSTQQHRLQFVPFGDNFSAVSSVLGAVSRSPGDSHFHMTPRDLKDSLFMTINKVVLHLKERRRLEAGQIVATVITCRDGSLVGDALDGLRDEEARYFDAMLVLRVVARVSADGVCEGSLFGQPLRVTWSPTSVFQSHGDFHRNAHLFLALCESLAARDEHLVVKLQTGGPRGGRPTAPTAASGHFVLTSGDECLLLRPIASAELGLPPPPPPPVQYDGVLAARAEQEVADALDALPVEEQYRAKDFPSGLCTALRLRADFPERLSLQQLKAGVPAVPAAPAPTMVVTSPPLAVSPPAPPAAPAPPSEDVDVVMELSSDDDELPELNVPAVALPGGTAAAGPAHKLGTGGHPALQDDFGVTPAKRSKFQPLHGVFKILRRH